MKAWREWVRFDRNELSGSFGDFGTDFPLIVGMILVAGLDTTSALVMFGAMQILTGLAYGLPMPVQPLKAMAVIVITQRLSGDVLFGGGLAIGVLMLLLSVSGLLGGLARLVPKSVVRGVQLGLGMQLALLALGDYVRADGLAGYALAALSFALTIFLLGNRRVPPALVIIPLGIAYGLLTRLDAGQLAGGVGLALPRLHIPRAEDVLTGLVVLALPQLPLSLANSVLATQQVIADYFPDRKVGVRKIGFTYALMNLINPFLSGIPTCHGSGGMAGHYTFGGRTGGSVILEGSFYVALGLFLSRGFQVAIELFPKPVLGVILFFEAVALMTLVRDVVPERRDFMLVLLVGLLCAGLPYGYVVGLVIGTTLAYLFRRRPTTPEE
ncbi:MAG TPA: putative sulfate/molybdate transporter [Candidatus Xenobia bacterium]|nr:putative sulfate/molybdate transporter [Candidatus Xenobia bacterium]